MKKNKIIPFILLIILTVIIILFLIRLILPSQIDDVSPEISCKKQLLEKADILYIIPNFNNKSMHENKEWCNQILSLNKELALHGFNHKYLEFKTDKNQQYLNQAINSFEQCFNKKPTRFKPPQLAISKNNKQLIKNKLNLDLFFNQLFHKVYHCNDTGKFPNWFINIF